MSNIDNTLHVATLLTSIFLNYWHVSVSCLLSMHVSVIDSYITSSEVKQYSDEIYVSG